MSELNFPPVRRRYYAVKTKLSAVRDRIINEMGYAEVLAKYEVKPSTFHVWLHKYKSRVLSEEQHKRLSSRNYKMLYPMTDQGLAVSDKHGTVVTSANTTRTTGRTARSPMRS